MTLHARIVSAFVWLAAFCLACGVFLSLTLLLRNLPPTAPEVVIKRCREAGTLTNLVNELVEKGTFCEVRGHRWEPGCGMMGCLVIHLNQTRHCAVCGLVQTQEVGPWK